MIRENAKFIDGIRELTALREAGFPKFLHGIRDFLPVIFEREFRKLDVPAANANQPGEH